MKSSSPPGSSLSVNEGTCDLEQGDSNSSSVAAEFFVYKQQQEHKKKWKNLNSSILMNKIIKIVKFKKG